MDAKRRAEIEAAARAATPGPYHIEAGYFIESAAGEPIAMPAASVDRVHLANCDPATVLDLCAAARAWGAVRRIHTEYEARGMPDDLFGAALKAFLAAMEEKR